MIKSKEHHPFCWSKNISRKDCELCNIFYKRYPVKKEENKNEALKRLKKDYPSFSHGISSAKKEIYKKNITPLTENWDDNLVKKITSKEKIASIYQVSVEVIEFYHKMYGENPRYYTIDISEEPTVKEELRLIERKLKIEKLKFKLEKI